MEFLSDRLANGRAFRVLALVDNVTRVSPAIEADFSLTRRRVTELLDRAVARYGLPQAICVDNGPEFAGKALDAWAYRGRGSRRTTPSWSRSTDGCERSAWTLTG
jgi:putative transposase